MSPRRTFASSEMSIGAARRFVTGFVADAPVDVRESVALMVSELATNALVHAAGGFDVTVERNDTTLLVSVSDRGEDGMPQMHEPTATEPHGRGLRLVDALCEEWGVAATGEEGKAVWFRISLQEPKFPPTSDGDLATVDPEPTGQSDDQAPTPTQSLAAANTRQQVPNAFRRGTNPHERTWRIRPTSPRRVLSTS